MPPVKKMLNYLAMFPLTYYTSDCIRSPGVKLRRCHPQTKGPAAAFALPQCVFSEFRALLPLGGDSGPSNELTGFCSTSVTLEVMRGAEHLIFSIYN